VADDYPSENSSGYHELKRLQYLRLRLAVITRVDPAKFIVDLKFRQETGGRTDVIMSASYWSAQAFMGVMPEEGAQCVIGFYHQGADVWMPVILQYLPTGATAARRIESQQIGLPSTGEDDPREGFSFIQRMRLRKVYPGQALMQSREGSDVVASKDILLSNSRGNEVRLRAADQTIVGNALGHVTNIPGGSIKMGPVTRNALVIDDHILRAGSEQFDIPTVAALIDPTDYDAAVDARIVHPIVLPNGKKISYVTELPLDPNQGPLPLTEYRTEIHEFTDLKMRITEDTDLTVDLDDDFTPPLVEQVMGTLVGKDASNMVTYGRPLKAVLFRSPTDSKGVFRLEEAYHGLGLWRDNEIRSLTTAYYLRAGGYQQAISKRGNVTMHIPASPQSGPTGDGHSLDANLEGAAKIALGKERKGGNSMYLTTEGSIKANIGKGSVDESGEKGRSVEVTTTAGVSFEINGYDQDQYSWREILSAKKRTEVGGDHDHEVKGNYNLTVHGVINEEILGKKVENYVGDKNTNYGGTYKETIVSDRQTMIGEGRKETIASGGDSPTADELTILVGNKVATLTLGNMTENIVAGNSLENITAGNKTISIGTGSFNVTVGTGGVNVTTALGSVNITTAAGAMTLTATGVVNITGGVVNVNGGSVNLGVGLKFGVVTTASPCLVTGAPHIGSLTVKASP